MWCLFCAEVAGSQFTTSIYQILRVTHVKLPIWSLPCASGFARPVGGTMADIAELTLFNLNPLPIIDKDGRHQWMANWKESNQLHLQCATWFSIVFNAHQTASARSSKTHQRSISSRYN